MTNTFMTDMFKVTKNGDTVIITVWVKNALDEYTKTIYDGKSGDFIELYGRNAVTKKWERIKKDWL